MMKLTRTASNMGWVLSTSAGTSVLMMVRGVVLARLLYPEDFGIVATALMLQHMLAEFASMGIGGAVVYRQKTSDDVLSVALIMKCAFSLTLAALIFLVAPLWASFFEQADVASVTRFGALLILAGILSFPPRIKAQVELRFKEQSTPRLVGTAIGCTTTVVLALLGFSYWSIMWGILIDQLVEAMLLARAFPWKVKLSWNSELARELWKYGLHMTTATMLFFLISQVDRLIIGKLLGLTALGYYTVAFRWATFGSKQIVGGTGVVLFPTFSRWHATDDGLVEKFETVMRMAAVLYLPISVGMLILAPDFVRIVLHERWMPAVAPMQILCVVAVFRSLGSPIGRLLPALGRPDLEAWFHAGFLATMVVLLIPFSLWFGLFGASLVMLITTILWHFLARLIALRRATGLGFSTVGRALLPALTASAVMTAGVFFAKSLEAELVVAPPLFLLFQISVGAVLYVAVIYSILGKELHSVLRPTRRRQNAAETVL